MRGGEAPNDVTADERRTPPGAAEEKPWARIAGIPHPLRLTVARPRTAAAHDPNPSERIPGCESPSTPSGR